MNRKWGLVVAIALVAIALLVWLRGRGAKPSVSTSISPAAASSAATPAADMPGLPTTATAPVSPNGEPPAGGLPAPVIAAEGVKFKVGERIEARLQSTQLAFGFNSLLDVTVALSIDGNPVRDRGDLRGMVMRDDDSPPQQVSFVEDPEVGGLYHARFIPVEAERAGALNLHVVISEVSDESVESPFGAAQVSFGYGTVEIMGMPVMVGAPASKVAIPAHSRGGGYARVSGMLGRRVKGQAELEILGETVSETLHIEGNGELVLNFGVLSPPGEGASATYVLANVRIHTGPEATGLTLMGLWEELAIH